MLSTNSNTTKKQNANTNSLANMYLIINFYCLYMSVDYRGIVFMSDRQTGRTTYEYEIKYG